MKVGVSILGIFVADTAYLARRMPVVGETITGSGFSVGPGGKGSNQAVACARAGSPVSFISKLGRDTFGEMALRGGFCNRGDAVGRAELAVVDDRFCLHVPTGDPGAVAHRFRGRGLRTEAGVAAQVGHGGPEQGRAVGAGEYQNWKTPRLRLFSR